MRTPIAAACLACAFVLHAGNAAATDEKLADYLARCQTIEAKCLSQIASYIDAGGQVGELCFPAAESFEDGAKQALDWLRTKAAAAPRFAQFTAHDATHMAFGTLWACKDR